MVRNPQCSCASTNALFSLFGKKWVLFIVRAVYYGKYSFTEIRHDIGECNTKILTDRLAELVESGILIKNEWGYALSKRGKKLAEKLLQMAEWWGENKSSS